MEQYSSAFHYFLVSIKFNSGNAQAYMFLGICLNEMNDSANAFNSFGRAVQLDPDNHLIYLNFAIFLASSDSEHSALAREQFEKHSRLFEGSPDQNDPDMVAQRKAVMSILGI